MTKNIIIGILAAVCVAMGCYIVHSENTRAQAINAAIQDTSDYLMTACDNRIDDLTAEYEDKIAHIEDNCADMVEDVAQEILAQF